MDETIREVLEELGTDKAYRDIDYKGYEVYNPVYPTGACVGLPLVIFKKGHEVRISTPSEALAYLRFKNSK